MKKYTMVIAILMLMAMAACGKSGPDDDTVRIYMYRYNDGYNDPFGQISNMIEDEITNYAQDNGIKVDIFKFNGDELSLSDYILKRNLALEQGSVDLIIDSADSDLYQASEYAGDYTKLNNYEDVFDNFKNHPFIPIATYTRTMLINRDVFDEYGIESEKYITLSDYYEFKQIMKENGARFRLDDNELSQLTTYYSKKYNLKIQNRGGKYDLDRELTLRIANDISEDLAKYYDLDVVYDGEKEEAIFDETTRKVISMDIDSGPFCPLKFDRLTIDDKLMPFSKYVVAICDDIEKTMSHIPCLLINKNTTKDNTYSVADYLLSDIFQGRMYESIIPFSTITESAKLKKRLGYDDHWNYIYIPGKFYIDNGDLKRKDIDQIITVVSDTYRMFKNIDTEKFFQPCSLNYLVLNFISEEALKLSQDSNYAEEDFDKSFDDFLLNLNVSYN